MSQALRPSGTAAKWTLRVILAGALVLMLKLNLPGHLTVDSVLALHEGRFGVRTTWNPAFFGWLLGVLDRIHTGTALAVGLVGVLLFGAWAMLPSLRPRTSWLAPIVSLGLVALPQAMIYPAIVWKDVQFAVAAVVGFVLLAYGVRDRARPTPWISLILAAVLFAAAGLLRQNGLILAVPAAMAIAWARSGSGSGSGGWLRSSALAAAWLAAVAALTLLLSAVAQPQGAGAPDSAGGKGLRILGTYDIVAASALQPGRPTPHIDKESPAAGAYLRQQAQRLYSAERVDTISQDPVMAALFKTVSRETIRAEWLDLIRHQPGLYLRARSLAFAQVVGTPIIDRCLPVTIGIDGPPETLKALDMPRRRTLHDQKLYNYVTWFMDTPAMSHLAFAVIALGVGVALLFRRDPADLAIVGLMAGALGFAASFFAISIACDYRYLYLLDVAAITGLLYLAIDPRLKRA
ncbi:MAG: hypothetical protein KKE02_20985 [Alphaproteobacteria bacterium]|nr:hypothetical protein [Alphaproteobacteria bacterium]MBU1514489.1 hypothetical protein [Alphaproteobacteria bacterium]MBU2096879.1 hypothetical protein [Alphaproteobacteria bacterium]MBU2153506.1 hypothetical protein [Alphaproteobacteria bacterium]MBU2305989.1 hypothetical protein [Alphaproteobacteria bacterium]